MLGRVVLSMSLTVASATFGQASRPAAGLFLLESTVVKRHAEQNMVALGIGRDAGIGVGDPFWLFDRSELCATGKVFLVTPDACVGRMTGSADKVKAGASAVILRQASLRTCRDVLPENVTLRGRLLSLPPGRRTAWLDVGRTAGLHLDDSMLVSRDGLPIARGRVSILEDETALAALQPLVGNTLSQPGDLVSLWPEPYQQRFSRVDSTVLDVRSDPEGALLTLAGTAADGLHEGRMVDLFRDGNYVGVAVLVEVSDPLSVAQVIESASARLPEVGDRAIVRSGPNANPHPLAVALFRVVQGNYCLLAAGESDGVRIGEKFIVHRPASDQSQQMRAIAELTVTTVKVYHCGCDVRMLGDNEPKLMPWDWAERKQPPWPHWMSVGLVKQVDQTHRSAIADLVPGSSLTRGQVVRWIPSLIDDRSANSRSFLPGAAIVLHVADGEALLYIPQGWGDIKHLNHAHVQTGLK